VGVKQLWVLLAGLLMSVGVAQVVHVAAASDLDFAMRELKMSFEASNPGVTVEVQLGSSGNFFNQIRQGLPVDMFFSANLEFPERLADLGLAEPDSLKLYAIGRMALWVSNRLIAAGLDPAVLEMRLLRDSRVTQLAIANPVHAPYGRGGVTLLEHYGLIQPITAQDWDNVDWEAMIAGVPAFYDISELAAEKTGFTFVYGENISQAAQLAMSATGVGLVALSLAISETMQRAGSYWLAPLESHLRLEQGYVILRGRDRPEVRALYDFIGSVPGREILDRYGFILP
jgi:molybdate transport system substrate-binding protein